MAPMPFFSLIVKKAMEAKLCLVLMLFILGSLTVQAAIPRNQRENPLAAIDKRSGVCLFFYLLFYFFVYSLAGHSKRLARSLGHGNYNIIQSSVCVCDRHLDG